MNWVDAALVAIVVLAMWGGWKKGFILGTVDLLVWIGSLLAGFIGYKFLGDFLNTTFPSLGNWTLPLSFLVIIVLTRLLLSIIFNRFLQTTPEHAHEHGVNRAFGLFPGFVNGMLYATIAAAILISVPISRTVSSATRSSEIANRLSVSVEWIDNKLSPIFGDAAKETINRLTIEPDSDETVMLKFTVDDAVPRPDLEAKMLEMVNKERVQRGLKPLKADPELVPVARAHSNDMFRRGYFSHYTLEGKDPFDRMKVGGVSFITAGENLALGKTLKICHEGLMNSPGHRANILRPTYGRLGIGIMDGGIYGLMISQEFRN